MNKFILILISLLLFSGLANLSLATGPQHYVEISLTSSKKWIVKA